jgi:hypothetical protein
MNASTLPADWSAARRFADRWQDLYPKAVACLRADLLTCLRHPTLAERKAVPPTRSSAASARSATAPDRWAPVPVFTHENLNQGIATPPLTYNS